MNRDELITEIAYRLKSENETEQSEQNKRDKARGTSKKTIAEMLDAYENVICEAISQNKTVALYGFLKIERKKRKGHMANNFYGDGLITIPDSEFVKITPGIRLKNAVG